MLDLGRITVNKMTFYLCCQGDPSGPRCHGDDLVQTGGTLIEKVQRCVRTTICIMVLDSSLLKCLFLYIYILSTIILAWGQLKICSY